MNSVISFLTIPNSGPKVKTMPHEIPHMLITFLEQLCHKRYLWAGSNIYNWLSLQFIK